ncbi:Spy/CpxP family protein refolding chaperone [Thioalkalivibrio sp. ALJ24]|uniref:Spy/CpxP family protein refolding chaperone n=1 Tax=Thioalkalivibrio sp. ALJ24 TaxID=545276 RepID=UPI00035C998A|nr:hypothetical protein [Thioalkalivibrio sp. ALJ24]
MPHRTTRWIFGLALVACAGTAAANPYADLQEREIKALSADEKQGLLEGQGLGTALPAELHGYPGPMHVLEVVDHLDLTSDQRAETERLYEEMRAEAIELGERIVELERELDEGFASREITEDRIEALSVEIGKLRGQLRSTHLAYHLKMDALMNEDQKAAYARARGYEGSDQGHHHRGHHGHDHGHGHHHGH